MSCSLVELLAGARLVNQQLAWGELFPVGSLVPLEPVHYLLSTIQVHEAEGPCGGSRTLLKETATRALGQSKPPPQPPRPTSETGGEAESKDRSDVSLRRCGQDLFLQAHGGLVHEPRHQAVLDIFVRGAANREGHSASSRRE